MIRSVALYEIESVKLGQVLYIGRATSAEIVDAKHLIVVVQQALAQRRADESGSPHYKCVTHK
ncbi:hypothetical protein A5651_24400 [Mycobacterium sp. 1274761.0]|nr:hypothetical protein A5651_24400 [Mycobacterium sp. 1274761.0]